MARTIALVGDHDGEKPAHRAIPEALELAAKEGAARIALRWVGSRELGGGPGPLKGISGVWAVPGCPYENEEGVLAAIRWARETGTPFLGTCAGFQHAVIEFARNVVGWGDAGHAESHPEAARPVIWRLPVSLVGKSESVRLAPGSRIAAAYGAVEAIEGYRCNYGLNPAYAAALEAAGLRYTAWDADGAVRAAELPGHPFYLGTLFQPERAALEGRLPPIVRAFARAAAA